MVANIDQFAMEDVASVAWAFATVHFTDQSLFAAMRKCIERRAQVQLFQ